MWLECRFLNTEVDGSNPGTEYCVLEQDTLSALLQSSQLRNEYQVGTTSRRMFCVMSLSGE